MSDQVICETSPDATAPALTDCTPAMKEAAILKSLWAILKQYDVTFDGAIRIAILLIINCARGSNSEKEAFDYAQRLLSRAAARAQ